MDSVNGLFYEKDRWNYQHASLRSNIEKSTFPHLRSRWSALSLQNGKRAELLPFVKLLHSYGLCPLNHQPYFPMLKQMAVYLNLNSRLSNLSFPSIISTYSDNHPDFSLPSIPVFRGEMYPWRSGDRGQVCRLRRLLNHQIYLI